MGRFANDSGSGSFVQAPVGTHIARCIKIVDIGTQHGEYQGKPNKRNQIIVSWELPTELEDDRPITTSRFYTNSLSEKANLRHDLEAWRGRTFTRPELDKFDLQAILGKPCLLTIVGGENGKTKVAAVSGLPKGMECPAQINETVTFWLDEFDQEKFSSLSDGIQTIIKKSDEWEELMNPSDGEQREPDTPGDDVPF